MFCRDQMYSSFRAWELVQAAERREGFAFAAVLRARADLYWSSPLPSLCRSLFIRHHLLRLCLIGIRHQNLDLV